MVNVDQSTTQNPEDIKKHHIKSITKCLAVATEKHKTLHTDQGECSQPESIDPDRKSNLLTYIKTETELAQKVTSELKR